MKNLVLILLFAPIFCIGQELKSPTIDKFTGDTTIDTSTEILSKYPRLTVSGFIIKTKKVKTSAIMFGVVASTVLSVSNRNNIIFKQSSGETFSIPCRNDNKIYSTNDNLFYMVRVADIPKSIENDPIVAIRFENSKFPLDYDINAKNQPLLTNTIKLIRLD